jgi:hypothetical protein
MLKFYTYQSSGLLDLAIFFNDIDSVFKLQSVELVQ